MIEIWLDDRLKDIGFSGTLWYQEPSEDFYISTGSSCSCSAPKESMFLIRFPIGDIHIYGGPQQVEELIAVRHVSDFAWKMLFNNMTPVMLKQIIGESVKKGRISGRNSLRTDFLCLLRKFE